MHDVMRNRILRKLEALPPERLYQVLDYIDFLESRYAAGVAPEPAGLQRFAERLEDRMRARTVAPRVIGGAMSALGAAGRLVDGVAGVGRDLAAEWESAAGALAERRRSRSGRSWAWPGRDSEIAPEATPAGDERLRASEHDAQDASSAGDAREASAEQAAPRREISIE